MPVVGEIMKPRPTLCELCGDAHATARCHHLMPRSPRPNPPYDSPAPSVKLHGNILERHRKSVDAKRDCN